MTFKNIPGGKTENEDEGAYGYNAYELCPVTRTFIGGWDDHGAPYTADKMHWNGANNVIKAKLVEQRYSEHHEDTANSPDQNRLPEGGCKRLSGNADESAERSIEYQGKVNLRYKIWVRAIAAITPAAAARLVLA